MTHCAVDGDGNRITTDILVEGYIRENAKKYNVLIPLDINTICFLFWLIKICDEWDKEFLAEGVDLDGEVIKYKGAPSTSSFVRVG